MSASREADALTWLGYALGDLAASRAQPSRRVRPRIAAFHAQQAAEKALKAALVLANLDPERTHDLDTLRNELPPGWRVKTRQTDLAPLSRYGVEVRYPDDATAITAIQAATAVRQAIAIVRDVSEDFERRGVATNKVEPQ